MDRRRPPPSLPFLVSHQVQVAILELFCRCDCKLPNMFVGTLTRDSVLKAVAKGITSDEIITYLHSRAHPQASARAPEGTIVPEVGGSSVGQERQ